MVTQNVVTQNYVNPSPYLLSDYQPVTSTKVITNPEVNKYLTKYQGGGTTYVDETQRKH